MKIESGENSATASLVPADPLLQFLAADVPLRTLLEHGAQALDWLAALNVSPIVMTYPDAEGGMVVEEVSKVGLIERAYQLGWGVVDEGCEGVTFQNAVDWQDVDDAPERVPGIWFSHCDCVEWEVDGGGAPLSLPSDRLRELKAAYVAGREKLHAERLQREADAIAKRDADAREGHEILIEGRIALHRRKGVEITREQAEREVLEMVEGFRGIRKLAVDLAAISAEGPTGKN